MNNSGFSYKTIWNVGYPIMIGNLAQTLIILTDTAFLGHLSEVALGASAMAGIYYYVFSTLAWGFAIGVQVIVARRFGGGSYSAIGPIFEHGMAFVVLLGAMLFLLMSSFTPSILDLLIDSPNVYREACTYMSYRQWGILFVSLNYIYHAFYVGVSYTKIIGYTTVITALINIVGDYTLIFGNWGMPQMGTAGAALASVCAEIASVTLFTIFTLTKMPLAKYRLFRFARIKIGIITDILKISLPTMGQKLISFSTWLFFFAMVERLGERSLAISMTVRSVYMFITIPVFAFGAGANGLTSRLLGEGRHAELNAMIVKIIKLCYLVVLPLSLFCFMMPETLLGIYTDNTELISEAVDSLHVVALCAFVMGFGQIFFESVSGTGNTLDALFLEFGVLMCYALYIFITSRVLGGPVSIVWISEAVYGALLGLISMIYLRRAKWQNKRI